MLTPELVFKSFTKWTDQTYTCVTLKEPVLGQGFWTVAQLSFDQIWLWDNRSAHAANSEPDFKVDCRVEVHQTVQEHRLPWKRWHLLHYREITVEEPLQRVFNQVLFQGAFYESARIDLRDFKLYCYNNRGGLERSDFLELKLPGDE